MGMTGQLPCQTIDSGVALGAEPPLQSSATHSILPAPRFGWRFRKDSILKISTAILP